MILENHKAIESCGRHGRQILQLLATRGPASRERLHRLSGLHRNLVGDTVRNLLADGLVRHLEPQVNGRGRPQTPMAIDLDRRCVLGIAIDPNSVSSVRVNLMGATPESATCHAAGNQEDTIRIATDLIRAEANDPLIAIGVSMTGVVIEARQALADDHPAGDELADIGTLRAAAGASPIAIENDLHALAQYWRMHERVDNDHDVLLVRLEDGAVAAAFVVSGLPHTGCVHAASELGHTRLAVETRTCYCGGTGCLERVFDSAFAQDMDGDARTLDTRIASISKIDQTTMRIIELAGMGIANAAHLMKPHRLVLVSQFAQHEAFRVKLTEAVQRQMIPSFRDHVMIEWWDDPMPDRAVAAASSAIALLLGEEPARTRSVASPA